MTGLALRQGYSSGEDTHGGRARGGSPGAAAGRSMLGGAGSGAGGEEGRAVEALCAPGGLRAAPDADALRLFVERVSGLDGARVAELLCAQLVRWVLIWILHPELTHK